jgi:hypothetical protein
LSPTVQACPAGTRYLETEGAGAANPKLAETEGAGAANPKLAETEGAGAANPKLASVQASGLSPGTATKLSNGLARMPDGTYCRPAQ